MPQNPNIPRICEQCGKTFMIFPCEARAKGQGRFCSRACQQAAFRGAGHPSYRGGRFLSDDGYWMVLIPGRGKYKPEHRQIMEQHLGRPLRRDELVHHINGDKTDNRIENLQVVTAGEHNTLHGCKHTRRWTKRYAVCRLCGSAERPHAGHGYCQRCKPHAIRDGTY